MKQIILFITAIVLISGLYLYLSKEDKPISKSFSVKEPFDKIFLTDMKGHSVVLSKNENEKWLLNKSFNVRPDAINVLLNTIKKVSVKSSVPKNQKENIYKKIASENIKVEIYKDDDILSTYYVGGPTNDYEGTYFFHDKLKEVFITHIPGFKGYLTPRYFIDEELWKDRSIINYNADQISSLSIHYFNKDSISFEFSTTPLSFKINNKEVNNKIIDLKKLNLYLNSFQNLEVEGFENNYSKKDSVLKSPEFCKFRLTDNKKITTNLRLFKMPISQRSKSQYNIEGKALKYDLDRLFVDINNNTEFGILQLYVFNKILVTPEFFLK